MNPNLAEPQSSHERKAQLHLQHPEECPELMGVLSDLMHPPSDCDQQPLGYLFATRLIYPRSGSDRTTQTYQTF